MITYPAELISTYFFSRPVKDFDKKLIEKRLVDCYEIEIITESNGGMYIDNQYFPVKKGDTIFRYPGQTTQGIIPYSCYTIRFKTSDPLFKQVATKNITSVSNEYSDQFFSIVEDIFNESINYNFLSEYYFQFQLARLIYLFLQIFHPETSKMIGIQNIHNLYVSECITFIQSNWQDVCIDDLVLRTGVTKPYLMKIFKKETGRTLLSYINEVKIFHIKKLLIFTNDDLTTISMKTGFKSSSYFSSYFLHHTNLSPKDFRNKHRI